MFLDMVTCSLPIILTAFTEYLAFFAGGGWGDLQRSKCCYAKYIYMLMEQAMDFCTVLRRSLHVHVNFSASD